MAEQDTQQPTNERPLAGHLVLELSTMVTCSLSAMTLRAQGARVIKIEPTLIGDPMRMLGHQKNGISALFHNCNRGKQSLSVDLKSDIGREAVAALAAKADVLLHNYRPGVMDRLGLGSDTLRATNDRLVNIAVTGFGTKGEMAHKPAYDHVIQGLSGMTDLQESEAGRHSFMRTLLCDKVTAYTVAQAATAALLARAHTGKGQHIDISMLHACLAFMWPDGMMHHTLHDDDVLAMPPMSEYYQVLHLKDGALAIAALQDHHYQALLPMIGYPELLDDPRFNSMGGRLMHIDEVMAVLKVPKTDIGVADAVAILEAADVPCTICETRDALSANSQIDAIGALETYVTENIGKLTAPTPPVLFGGNATSLAEPSPTLGADSRAILAELGYADAAIDAAAEAGSVLFAYTVTNWPPPCRMPICGCC